MDVCSVLRCVAVCCGVLQCAAANRNHGCQQTSDIPNIYERNRKRERVSVCSYKHYSIYIPLTFSLPHTHTHTHTYISHSRLLSPRQSCMSEATNTTASIFRSLSLSLTHTHTHVHIHTHTHLLREKAMMHVCKRRSWTHVC